ncbi:MAG TPA: gliding motility-associated C-terminal domain-containing protein [Saprospiraceae bacterium]|nr:gliding motility-associated C-terminal domain-containing protein [Saprospiraceae bacterium]
MNLKGSTILSSKPSLIRFKYLLYGLIFLGTLPKTISAQILPPDLYCVKNDTLLWTPVVNNCGAFISYDIYAANNASGPYSLIFSVTNLTQTSYFNSNANGMTWYYYMLSNYNCPGQVSISSDTLDNLIPPKVPIESITVANGKTKLSWQTPITTKQIAYVIYKNTPGGIIPIDTVANVNSYIDQSSNPDLQSEVYYILSLDLCGNVSLFDKAHYSIFLTAIKDSCKSVVNLNWSAYQNWVNGVKQYQVLTSTNSGPFILKDTVPGNITKYELKDLTPGDTLCVIIKALEVNSTITSSSNIACLEVKILWQTLSNTSVNAANLTDLDWEWSTNVPFQSADLYAGTTKNNINSKLAYTSMLPLMQLNNYSDLVSKPSFGPVYYQIRIKDVCNNIQESNILSTVYLSGKANNDITNTLNWVFPAHDKLTINAYSLHRIVNAQDLELITVPETETSFIDPIDINNPAEENVCYYVEALGNIEILPGFIKPDTIRSNTVCLGQSGTLYFPNAFAPDGLNDQFKPASVFTNDGEYQLLIYDRWGKKVFESNDIDIGWNGAIGFVALPIGVYAYYAKLRQSNGNVIERKGTVMLVR